MNMEPEMRRDFDVMEYILKDPDYS